MLVAHLDWDFVRANKENFRENELANKAQKNLSGCRKNLNVFSVPNCVDTYTLSYLPTVPTKHGTRQCKTIRVYVILYVQFAMQKIGTFDTPTIFAEDFLVFYISLSISLSGALSLSEIRT